MHTPNSSIAIAKTVQKNCFNPIAKTCSGYWEIPTIKNIYINNIKLLNFVGVSVVLVFIALAGYHSFLPWVWQHCICFLLIMMKEQYMHWHILYSILYIHILFVILTLFFLISLIVISSLIDYNKIFFYLHIYNWDIFFLLPLLNYISLIG